MRCVNHPEKQWAVVKCDECGVGLCQQCAEQWVPPLCRGCAPGRLVLQKGKAAKELVYLALAFLLGGYFLISSTGDTKVIENRGLYFLLGGIILAGALAGWRLIDQRRRVTFLWVSNNGAPMHLAFRVIICALLGPFLLPLAIYSNIKKYKDAQEAERSMASANK